MLSNGLIVQGVTKQELTDTHQRFSLLWWFTSVLQGKVIPESPQEWRPA